MFRIRKMLCPALLIIAALSVQSSGQTKPVPNELELPNRGIVDDYFDYELSWAFPAQIGYIVEEYSLEGDLLHTYEHDSYDSALDQKDFLETRMPLNYRISEFEHPQKWFRYGVYDRRADALLDEMFVRSLGFDTDIRRIAELTLGSKTTK